MPQECAFIQISSTEFICDSLTDTCNANQAAKDLCATARTAASSAEAGTGAQADAFNEVFGIQTVRTVSDGIHSSPNLIWPQNFGDVPSVDNQGNEVPSTSAPSVGSGAGASTTRTASAATLTETPPAATSSTASAGGAGDFGSCSTPEIEFGIFEGRRETTFRPADLCMLIVSTGPIVQLTVTI